MADTVKVAFADYFLNSFAELPRQIQSKVTEFINKFKNNPKSSAIHFEKLKYCVDDKIYSARINDEYRAIIAIEEETGVYLILWVDHHDEAYQWAKRKKCLINKDLGTIQIFDVSDKADEQKEEKSSSFLFDNFSKQQLLEIGVPEEQIVMVKHIIDENEFISMKQSFSKETYEILEWLVNGFNYEEVKALYDEQRVSVVPETIEEALENNNTKQSFIVVEGEEELVRIMSEPLEKWRIFLHPSQRVIVEKNYSGSAKVTGGAGTGKTVVAMHRAKYLTRKLSQEKRVLFTTYTANLASDIEENLKKICNLEELRKIDVMHIDLWISKFLRLNGYNYTIKYDEDIDELWQEALINSGEDLQFDSSFLRDEYNKIIVCLDDMTLQSYMTASRIGRGVKIDRPSKNKIWHVVEEYRKLLADKQVRDIDTAMYECRKILQTNYKNQYQYIVVDEGQDLSTNAYKLIRFIAGEEHENDIFIVGDTHQRIYKKKAVLSKCGINVRGRSSVLKINYRTTEEIRKYAFALLKGISFDDLDSGLDVQDKCQSLTHGDKPIVEHFKDGNAEFEFIHKEIKHLIDSGVEAKNICLICRTNKYVDQYCAQLAQVGIKNYEIKRSNKDDRSRDGIRIATMHRVKGLEFQYVFIVACNDRVIPLASAVNNSDPVIREENLVAERCLLYVSLTRAQKKAYITSYGEQSEFIKK